MDHDDSWTELIDHTMSPRSAAAAATSIEAAIEAAIEIEAGFELVAEDGVGGCSESEEEEQDPAAAANKLFIEDNEVRGAENEAEDDGFGDAAVEEGAPHGAPHATLQELGELLQDQLEAEVADSCDYATARLSDAKGLLDSKRWTAGENASSLLCTVLFCLVLALAIRTPAVEHPAVHTRPVVAPLLAPPTPLLYDAIPDGPANSNTPPKPCQSTGLKAGRLAPRPVAQLAAAAPKREPEYYRLLQHAPRSNFLAAAASNTSAGAERHSRRRVKPKLLGHTNGSITFASPCPPPFFNDNLAALLLETAGGPASAASDLPPDYELVRHRLYLVFPLPSRLRQRLCHAIPLPSWLRHCLCLVLPHWPSWAQTVPFRAVLRCRWSTSSALPARSAAPATPA